MTQSIIAALASADLVVSVGSVDGILTSAAVLRLIGKETEIVFTQAFAVDKLPVATWSGRRVVLVDLAVNNREPEMTLRFVDALEAGDNTLVAIVDEHSREDWAKVLGNFDRLAIEPQSQNAGPDAPKSSGEVLRRALEKAGEVTDDHTLALLRDADAGDRMDFTTHFGGAVNQAVKSDIGNDSRRVYLAHHFAFNREADPKVKGWIVEYAEILENHSAIIGQKLDLGAGIVRISTVGRKVDITTLMATLYKGGAKVVVCEGEIFSKALGRKTRQIAFGTDEKSFDLLACLKAVVATASGFAQKANVDPEHEETALSAIRAALTP